MKQQERKTKNRTKVIVVKNGIPKEVSGLSTDIVSSLEDAYDKTEIIGISRDTYNSMVEILEPKLRRFYENLDKLEKMMENEDEMYYRTIAFCNAFDIYSNESKMLMEALLWVDRSEQEHESFSSRNVSEKELSEVLHNTTKKANVYGEACKEFQLWARKLFESTGVKVGLVRFCKFFLSVLNTEPVVV